MFITFEGGEGSGKSTQSQLLAQTLQEEGCDVILTREPGGTSGAESIRKLVLTGNEDRWAPVTEALLYLAARADHWYRIIKPSLDAGKIVISDRFQDSSVVYQGLCKGVSVDFLNRIYQYITSGIFPDRTYLLSVSPEIGVKRSISRKNNEETRFENMYIDFHKSVFQNFLKIAEENSRFLVVDGNRDINVVAKEIYEDFCLFLAKR
ncbi:MAG: dTMP kinase [Holosporales bacterium]|jgi:dTMP kinase|nr:dTMP kinase [Holosporales bacterium]